MEVWQSGSIGTILIMTVSLVRSLQRKGLISTSCISSHHLTARGRWRCRSHFQTWSHQAVPYTAVLWFICTEINITTGKTQGQTHWMETDVRERTWLVWQDRLWFTLVEEQNQSWEAPCYQGKDVQMLCCLHKLLCSTEAGIIADFWVENRGFSVHHNRTKQVEIN